MVERLWEACPALEAMVSCRSLLLLSSVRLRLSSAGKSLLGSLDLGLQGGELVLEVGD